MERKWSCGLVEFQLSATPSHPVYICCNLVRESTVGPFSLPILRQIDQKTTEFKQVTYIPLKQHSFQSIRVFIRTLDNTPLPRAININQGSSLCTLHFKRLSNEMIRAAVFLSLMALCSEPWEAWEPCRLPSGCRCGVPVLHEIHCQNITVFPIF